MTPERGTPEWYEEANIEDGSWGAFDVYHRLVFQLFWAQVAVAALLEYSKRESEWSNRRDYYASIQGGWL